ncbi:MULTISPECIES: DUF1538 domain-containing protein [Methanobacterium]|jgi:hypothetical protein|uniref:DUF1538 domain-containing protein n=1 Tax=Methanobacterium veterum TaxID=408577 RepID=A0A9E4ZUW9_9EURY|nr:MULTISPECIES: DUF1538 domain-containing protein [Methanobacterium]MCZ3364566.1 DUF1538 domain-containing protein [Methanobacterium veterum]MCZ3372320.1 DUF1538 domain-containing protein [Methanobacterium veterum]
MDFNLPFEVFIEVIEAIIPVIVLFIFFQIIVLKKIPPNFRRMIVGILMTTAGFFLFILGARMSLIPMGEKIGIFLSGANSLLVLFLVFVIGIIVIFAEPAVNILAYEIEKVSAGFLKRKYIIPVIALGVGFALVLIILRIYFEIPIAYILIPGYVILLFLTYKAPKDIISIAFDSGAVATGPVVVTFALPIITSIAITILGGESGVYGLGTIGVIAMCPIILMLLFGIIIKRRIKK